MKQIAVIAHDGKKVELASWINYGDNKKILSNYKIIGTSGTAKVIKNIAGIDVVSMGHGPNEGGDIRIANKILDNEICAMFFFVDMEVAHAHSVDIDALIRTAIIKNIPVALNKSTADILISSLE